MFHCPARGALPGFSLYPPNLDENGTVCASPGDSELHAWVQHGKVNQQRGSRLLGLGGPSLGPALPPPQLGGTPEGHRDRPGDVLPPQSPGSAHCGAQTGPAVGAPPPTPAGGGTQLLDVSAGCAVLVCDLPRRLLVPLPETQASGAGARGCRSPFSSNPGGVVCPPKKSFISDHHKGLVYMSSQYWLLQKSWR